MYPRTLTHTAQLKCILPLCICSVSNVRALFRIDCHFNFICLPLIRIRYVWLSCKEKIQFNLEPLPQTDGETVKSGRKKLI